MRFNVKVLAIGLGVLMSAACQLPQKEKATDLKSVKVPAGFTFQTSHSVELKVASASTSALTIQRPDGKVVYQGHVTAGQQSTLRLPVPTKDEKLIAIHTGADGKQTRSEIAINGDKAMYQF
ncbi:MAG: hypothetical protein JST92_19245 [Deltaproteobacteria bacterium]|nr:hypothetical protein [Deltaproteobacteria bacterium]